LITGLSARLSPATVAECRRLTSAVMRSAVRNRLIAFNPCEEVKVPRRRRQDTPPASCAPSTTRTPTTAQQVPSCPPDALLLPLDIQEC
jgi:hypothetical protein